MVISTAEPPVIGRTRLPNNPGDVNAATFGQIAKSWRVGSATLSQVTPPTAWKLTDATNSVYFKPTCSVNWTVKWEGQPQSDCTTGYKTAAFAATTNTLWENTATYGIGINNSGSFCSMRAYESDPVDGPAMPLGAMASCNYNTTQRVSLWFK